MNTINLKNDLINQINLLSEEQLKTVMAFVNNLYQQRFPIQENQTIKQEERILTDGHIFQYNNRYIHVKASNS